MDSGVIFWIIVGIIIYYFYQRRKRMERRANAIRFLLLEINNHRRDMEGQNILTIKFKEKLDKFSDDDLCNIFDLHCINIDANMVLDGRPIGFHKINAKQNGG